MTRHSLAWLTFLVLALANTPWAHALGEDRPEWAVLDAQVRAQIAARQLPGAVLIFGDAHRIWMRHAWGARTLAPKRKPMTVDTVFDLASLTKVVATTTSILQLAEQGRLQLDAPAALYWPDFGLNGKACITVRQLLSHSSGLRGGLDLKDPWQGHVEGLRRAVNETLVSLPGTQTTYSDINFIVLGELVRRVSGLPLDVYVQRHVLSPLHMNDTGFTPPRMKVKRIAPTEASEGRMLQGIVHDPTARRMGGVAGHAGLFGTADDLARFAQAILRHDQVLKPSSVASMQAPQGPVASREGRGLGWQLLAPLVANRDDLPPLGMIGHTGYTGTGIWIDLVQGRFIVLLSSRVHPDGKGDVRPLRRQVLALLSSLSAPMFMGDMVTKEAPRVSTGMDVLRAQGYAPLAGRRIGLITHLAAIDSQGWRTLDRLRWAPNLTLVKVFSPEHGLNADMEGQVASSVEPLSGLPLVSLYGTSTRPDARFLKDIDTLVVDLQDVGTRYFTYASTLGLAMEAAAEHHLRVVVLDRPNPIRADKVAGPVMDEDRRSFTGFASLPVQHGMTMGELALLYQQDILERRHLPLDLQVIAMSGYERSMSFEQTGLDWVPPSPNLRTPNAARLYPGVAWIEGSNVSVGRGTDRPFEWVGAPWIRASELAETLNRTGLKGVAFKPIDFTPDSGPYSGRVCHGIEVSVTDRDQLDAPLLGAALIQTLHEQWPVSFAIDKTEAILASRSTSEALRHGLSAKDVAGRWQDELTKFTERRKRHLLYPDDRPEKQ